MSRQCLQRSFRLATRKGRIRAPAVVIGLLDGTLSSSQDAAGHATDVPTSEAGVDFGPPSRQDAGGITLRRTPVESGGRCPTGFARRSLKLRAKVFRHPLNWEPVIAHSLRSASTPSSCEAVFGPLGMRAFRGQVIWRALRWTDVQSPVMARQPNRRTIAAMRMAGWMAIPARLSGVHPTKEAHNVTPEEPRLRSRTASA